jgi:hypothetical protein
MRTKNFRTYLETRLNLEEIAEIEKQAELEVKILIWFQQAMSDALKDYMKKNDIGFNALVKRLDSTPTHVAKIQRGEANLTMSSIAHILALVGKEPQDVFKRKK